MTLVYWIIFLSDLGKLRSLQGYPTTIAPKQDVHPPPRTFIPFPVSCQCQIHVFFLLSLAMPISFSPVVPTVVTPRSCWSSKSFVIYQVWCPPVHVSFWNLPQLLWRHALWVLVSVPFLFLSLVQASISECLLNIFTSINTYNWTNFGRQWPMLIHPPFLFPNGKTSISMIQSPERKNILINWWLWYKLCAFSSYFSVGAGCQRRARVRMSSSILSFTGEDITLWELRIKWSGNTYLK